ncbi:MAG: hypothetical protein U1D33_01315 [bacterium]|nr:hypothetical protein [bacterium]
MNLLQFLNRPVILMISEPWDFGTECGVGPFTGSISDIEGQRVLIKLDEPIKYEGKFYYTMFGKIRHEGFSMTSLAQQKPISLNFVLLAQEINLLIDVTKNIFSGGTGLIGTIEIK